MKGHTPVRYDPITRRRIGWVPPERVKDEHESIEQQIGLQKRMQRAVLAREHLLPYMQFVMPDPEAPNDIERSAYKATRMHTAVAKDLEQFIKGEILNADGSVCRQLIFEMPPRHGKSCAHDTPVLTPSGWTTHGDLRIGDEVFGPDGVPTKVIGLSKDVDEVVPVTLSNGDVVRCHLNHEWTVFDRATGRWRTLETRDIKARKLRNGPDGRRGGRWTLQLPFASAAQFAEKDLPIDPYVLGAWLGDGTADRGQLAFAESDRIVADRIAVLGFPSKKEFAHSETGVRYTVFDGLRQALSRLGVLKNKHIPEAYLRSSARQRLSLLAGLVDTDGHVCRNTGRVRIVTCDEKLRDGMVDLLTTLGFRPSVSRQEPAISTSGVIGRRPTYYVSFFPTVDVPTAIDRKRTWKLCRQKRIGIVSVGDVERAGARSIQVDRPDGLYMVGRTCVVTHNTQLSTKGLTAWVSGRCPDWSIGVASYSDTMAEDFGADTRALMQTPQHRQVFPEHKLRKGGTSKSNMQTEKGGRLVFVGRGGALTGRGMNLGIGDDLFKDHEEARSPAIRDAAWNWFTKVFMTRRMGEKLVILTMTRWHSDDVIGRITDPENPNYNEIEARKWKIIRLPAIAEEDDPLGRAEGEPLWPEEFGLDFLQSQQRLDPLGFAALYQQRPTVADGVMFRRENIQRYKPGQAPERLHYYCGSDHAVSTKQRNDKTCLIKAGMDAQDNMWLTELFWERVPTDKTVEAMLQMGSGATAPILWFAESGHISKSIGPFLRKRMEEERSYFAIREITPKDDKETRAQSIAGRVAMGKVYIPEGPMWDKAIEEMLAFPNGLHDDFVDALSMLGLGLRSTVGAPAPTKPKAEPKTGTLAWLKKNDDWERAKKARAAQGVF